jgi:DNA modification methylase
MRLTKERQLTNNSWIVLERNEYDELPAELEMLDMFGARDCGWVSQMSPFIRAFSEPGDLVLDPFAGLGTTLLAAVMEERNAIGIEIEASRIGIIEKRLAMIQQSQKVILLRDDARTPHPEMESTIDLCITNIPYFGAYNEFTPSKLDGQTYCSTNYQSYLEILNEIFSNIRTWLKNEKFAILMCENLHLDGRGFVPLAWDVSRILQQHFELCDERIICYEKQNELFFDKTRSNRSHEYALICRNTKHS